jgi:predicted small secreted protein
MKLQFLKPALAVFGVLTLLAASSCRNTAHGVVNDTKRNTNKVGKGVEHVGNKIGQGVERTGEKIQDSTR